ncbi:MAG: TonB-dependent receptor [Bacteroidota bacterium]
MTRWSALAAALFVSIGATAQTPSDSLWARDLGAVSISPAKGATVPAMGGATLTSLPLNASGSASPTLAQTARRLPGAHVQTNSRGEALVYLRGSGERQIAITLDGAPLGTAWDRRADLGLIPTWGLERASVATGTPSITWGPNAIGGALALTSRRASSPGALTEAGGTAGWPGSGRLAAAHVRQQNGWSLSLAADASARTGEALASGAPLPFGQAPEALRTNTDQRRAALLARLARGDLALTVLHSETARGISPEGHLNPTEERVRYWRYPTARQSLAVLNARERAGWWSFGSTAWVSASALTIEEYANVEYETITASERDLDASGGLRLLAELPRAWGVFRATVFGLAAQHRQRDSDAPEERFRHVEGSAGIEAETGGQVRVSGGVALDGLAPLETGLRPDAGPFRDVALHAGLVADLASGWRLRAGGGRKTRFPSMRELFGGALGRFALNPDLRPEAAWLAEAGLETERQEWSASGVLFARDVSGTIEQIQLQDGRRQRVNLGGSWAVGLEARASFSRGDWSVDAASTILRQRSDAGERLTERPAALGRLAVGYAPATWRLSVAADGIGGVVSPAPDGLAELPGAVLVSAEAVRQWIMGGSLFEVSARVENALDAVHEPQIGLPAPGRQVSGGVRLLW